MRPLQKIPLEVGKADFTPLVAILIIFLVAGCIERGWHVHKHDAQGRITQTTTVIPSLADAYRAISR